MLNEGVRRALHVDDWFLEPGVYVMVDGQYGSSGKGVLANLLAEEFGHRVVFTLTNAGPNSGHTAFMGNHKVVLKQLPTFAVASKRAGNAAVAILTAGAVIDPEIYAREIDAHGIGTVIHPCAAVINADAVAHDQLNVRSIASTGTGVGPALAAKIGRTREAVFGDPRNADKVAATVADIARDMPVFMEVSQGFSLGINQHFYPCVTSRECTVSQAMADAGLPPTAFRKCFMALRTYPIRVGSTENSSGDCYDDQEEIDWSDIGVEPELTTVTRRKRRLFTWSDRQFYRACQTNHPTGLFINFMNYLKPEERGPFVDRVLNVYHNALPGSKAPTVLLGFGPKSEDVHVWQLNK